MSKSELVTRVSPGDDRASLLEAPVGCALRVRSVADAPRSVEAEGLFPGARVTVERRIALGGPLIVEVGRARLSVPRSVAAAISVERVVS